MTFRSVARRMASALGVALTIVVSAPQLANAQESGIAEAQAAVKAKPADVDASLAYGRALRRAGRETEALAELRRGAMLTAGRADAATMVPWEIARTYIAKRDFEPALATCKGMARPPVVIGADFASHVCAAEAHLLWRRGTEASAELAELAKALAAPNAKPASIDVRYFAQVANGRALELASKDADAESAYRDAIAIADNRPDAHMRLGAVMQRRGEDGVAELKKAVSLDAHDATAEVELARALGGKGPEAIAALERAVAERPTYTDAQRLLADAYLSAGRTEDAKRASEAALKLAPNDAGVHVTSGRIALVEGHPDEAIHQGELASRLMPNDEPARLLVADGWAKKGEIDLAVEAYQAAMGLDHSDPSPLVNASRACLAAGRVTSAKAFGVKATKEFASSGEAWIALGDALTADQDSPGARAAYENAKRAKGADVASLDKKLGALK